MNLPTQTSAASVYLHQEVPEAKRPHFGEACWFVGIDLAPNDTLETGFTVLDKSRTVMRMDKISTNEQIVRIVENLSPPSGSIVVIDVPKSLSIPSKWRQLEIKYFPLRLENPHDSEPTDRFSPRAWTIYQQLRQKGLQAYLSFNHLAKQRYGLHIPYKTRTPQGCKALQGLIEHQLRLINMPTNLSPSSVLEATIAAYIAWSAYAGDYGSHYRLFADRHNRQFIEPLISLPVVTKRR